MGDGNSCYEKSNKNIQAIVDDVIVRSKRKRDIVVEEGEYTLSRKATKMFRMENEYTGCTSDQHNNTINSDTSPSKDLAFPSVDSVGYASQSIYSYGKRQKSAESTFARTKELALKKEQEVVSRVTTSINELTLT